jgi:RNA polymerase-associated protein CTR9
LQYEHCLKKFYNNKDPTVLLYLAKANFEAGKMQDCKEVLQKAIHLTPSNNALWFNLALCQEQYSASVLRKSKASVAEVKKAYIELSQALRIFKRLVETPGNKLLLYNVNIELN